MTSDMVAAIEDAVKDGVDIISYSIGGGTPTNFRAATMTAFMNAGLSGRGRGSHVKLKPHRKAYNAVAVLGQDLYKLRQTVKTTWLMEVPCARACAPQMPEKSAVPIKPVAHVLV